MQIFNFNNGSKGKRVGETSVPHSVTGNHVPKGKNVFSVSLSENRTKKFFDEEKKTDVLITTLWTNEAFLKNDKPLDPKDFGCEAILFCLGCDTTNHGKDERWDWRVIGTLEWNRKAIKNGILHFEKIT